MGVLSCDFSSAITLNRGVGDAGRLRGEEEPEVGLVSDTRLAREQRASESIPANAFRRRICAL